MDLDMVLNIKKMTNKHIRVVDMLTVSIVYIFPSLGHVFIFKFDDFTVNIMKTKKKLKTIYFRII